MARRVPKVVFWNNMPTPYVVGRFNALAATGAFDFEAWFSVEREADRNWDVRPTEWKFPARYLANDNGRFNIPIAELRSIRPDVLVSGYGNFELMMSVILARAFCERVALRVLPTFDSWVPRKFKNEQAKRLLFRAVDGAKVSGPDAVEYVSRYGLPKSRTFEVTQSIDVEHFRRGSSLAPDIRTFRRRELGLTGCVFLYVGRLWSKKGLDVLLDAFKIVRLSNPDVSLLLVGDGIDAERYREVGRKIANVVFVDFVQPQELPRIYGLADAMVFPTLGDPHGLVVEEAMASGVPVISSTAAGNIRTRLPHDEAGLIFESGNTGDLSKQMNALASSPRLRGALATKAQFLVSSRSHQRYASDFEQFIEKILSMQRRQNLVTQATWPVREGMRRMAISQTVAPLVKT